MRSSQAFCDRETDFEDFGLPRPPFVEPPVELMVLFGFQIFEFCLSFEFIIISFEVIQIIL